MSYQAIAYGCIHLRLLSSLIVSILYDFPFSMLKLGVVHKLREQDLGLFLRPPPPLWTDMNILKTPPKNYVNIL